MKLADLITNITLDTTIIFLTAFATLFILSPGFYSTRNMQYKQRGFLILKIIITGTIIFSIYSAHNEIKYYREINDIPILVEHGYELFIDGQKIDLQYINLDDYSFEIKNEEKIIILSK